MCAQGRGRAGERTTSRLGTERGGTRGRSRDAENTTRAETQSRTPQRLCAQAPPPPPCPPVEAEAPSAPALPCCWTQPVARSSASDLAEERDKTEKQRGRPRPHPRPRSPQRAPALSAADTGAGARPTRTENLDSPHPQRRGGSRPRELWSHTGWQGWRPWVWWKQGGALGSGATRGWAVCGLPEKGEHRFRADFCRRLPCIRDPVQTHAGLCRPFYRRGG